MTKEDNYRQHAADLFRLAQTASTQGDRGRLLRLAEAWLDLSDRSKALVNRYRRRLVRKRDMGPISDFTAPTFCRMAKGHIEETKANGSKCHHM